MIAFKLFKIRKDGSVGSLFINSSEKYQLNKWMDAKEFKKKGFANRKGWHCLLEPNAPHLKTELSNGEQRKFFKVEIKDYDFFERPKSQGGRWALAQKMKIIEENS